MQSKQATRYNRAAAGVLSDVKTYIDSKTKKINNPILLLGHSHGGNVAKRMTNSLVRDLQKMVKSGELAEMPEIRLVYLNSPSEAWDSGLNYDARKYVNELNIEAIGDKIASFGSTGHDTYNEADHVIKYEDQFEDGGCGFSNHCGQEDVNAEVWYPQMQQYFNDSE